MNVDGLLSQRNSFKKIEAFTDGVTKIRRNRFKYLPRGTPKYGTCNSVKVDLKKYNNMYFWVNYVDFIVDFGAGSRYLLKKKKITHFAKIRTLKSCAPI